MKRILFRCDSSYSIGSGHVIRCRTLARELQRRYVDVVFICRKQSGDLIFLLQKEFRVLVLPELALQYCDHLNGRPLYEAWLGCSQSQDAYESIELINLYSLHPIDWIVVDHYGLDSVWEDILFSSFESHMKPRLFVIDDLADRTHISNLLLDSNFFGCSVDSRYRELVPDHCTKLLGPKYALLGPEYSQLHSILPVRSTVRRILLSYGGVDALNFTGRVLNILQGTSIESISVDIVLGHNSIHLEAISTLIDGLISFNLHSSLPSLAGLIARADLSIGAVGVTTLERACLGLPSIITPIADNQKPCVQPLVDHGSALYLPEDCFEDQLPSLLCNVTSSNDWISTASQRSFELLEGLGAKLVSDILLSN